MQLWNDYEGKTLAGTFPIEMLLRTEGRNASFATHDRQGRPAVLRLTEALNDEQQLRARFGAVQDIGQPNLVTIEDFGAAEIEGTPLIYLVMESTEENLEEILRQRTLSIEETGEVALSLAAAVEALHAHGLVHGMVEPASVLAAGNVVKLRSDCVRLAPEGAEGDRARAADVFGLADVLHRALTQQRLQDASDALALPEPYATIVRQVVRGSWGIEPVAAELRRSLRPALPPASLLPEPPTPSLMAAVGELPVNGHRVVPSTASEERGPVADQFMPRLHTRAGKSEVDERSSSQNRHLVTWGTGLAGLCLMALLVWHFAGTKPAEPAARAAGSTAPIAAAARRPVPPLAAPKPAPPPANAAATASVHGAVWRVVAYTYNGQSQAEAKARKIAERGADLHPQVFSRTGRAPYLVTLGGPLTQQQAAAMLRLARSQGLARDVYMQNYSR